MSRGDLNEAEWRLLKDLLPPERGRKSRPAFDNRQIVNGILWRIRSGAPWRDLPEKLGKWNSVYQQFRRWSLSGLWDALLDALSSSGAAPKTVQMIDSTVIRAHHQAAGAKRGLKNRLLAVRAAALRAKFTPAPTA